MSTKKRFTISVEIEIDNWLTQKAKKSDRSKSGLVSHLLGLCMKNEFYDELHLAMTKLDEATAINKAAYLTEKDTL